MKKALARLSFSEQLPLIYLVIMSLFTNVFFSLSLSSKAEGFGDAWARLNIARRVVDSLTPGLVQLGGIWLPFPQILLVPFAAVDWIYYGGFAGVFISSPAFVLGGLYLYKSLRILIKNRALALFGFFLYANNLNIIYMQTTTMSESLFLAALFGAVYHFIRWEEDVRGHIFHLVVTAFWVFVATLTRYEGFFILGFTFLAVMIIAFIKTRKKMVSEGLTILFVTLAGFGVFMWLVYSWVIYKDPFNWLRIYRGEIASVTTVVEKPKEKLEVADNKGNLKKSLLSVAESSLEMNGLLMAVPLGAGSVLLVLYFLTNKKNATSLRSVVTLFISAAPVFFIFYSNYKGTAVVKNPPVDINMLFDTNFYQRYEYNIRYGLMAVPFIIFFTTLSFSWRPLLRRIFIVLSAVQCILFFVGIPVTIYSLPHQLFDVAAKKDKRFVDWFHAHYDGGFILSSAMVNDAVMYSLKIPYKSFIYEGAGKYWKESVIDPAKYARWVVHLNGSKVTDPGGAVDFVSYYLQDTPQLNDYYDQVYKDAKLVVYKIKEQTP